jgi:hypothetical protein
MCVTEKTIVSKYFSCHKFVHSMMYTYYVDLTLLFSLRNEVMM